MKERISSPGSLKTELEEFIDQDLEQDAENEEETKIAESKGESG
jgi:hypothetical protein